MSFSIISDRCDTSSNLKPLGTEEHLDAAAVFGRSSIGRCLTAFAIALIVLAPGISTPFIKDAEPQSAQWIVDIVNRGHWLLPVDYYGFVDRKPPLYYWLSAGVVELSGGRVDEVHARVVSLIAAAAIATIVFEWTTLTIGSTTGWLAFLFLIGSYGFASRATTALTDMLMTLLIFSAYCLIHPALDEPPSRSRIAAGGVLMGLALLTKGPVAAVLLVFALAIYLLMVRRNPLGLLRMRWAWAVAIIATVIAAGWYVPAFIEGRRHDLGGVFVAENFGHFLPSSMGGTGEAARPIYYIGLRMVGGMLPLSLLLPALAIAFASRAYPENARRPLLYQVAMVLAVLIFFSLASAKRDDYILPAMPSLAIVLASLFTSAEIDTGWRIWTHRVRDLSAGAIALLVLLGVTALAAGSAHQISPGQSLQSSDASYLAILLEGFSGGQAPFVVFTIAELAGATIVFCGVFRRALLSGAGLAVISVAGVLLWNGILRPREAATRSLGGFVSEVRARADDARVYSAYPDPELAWYFGAAVPPLPRDLAQQGAPAGGDVYLIARPRELVRLSPPVRRHLHLIIASNLLGGGGPPALYQIPPSSEAESSSPKGALR